MYTRSIDNCLQSSCFQSTEYCIQLNSHLVPKHTDLLAKGVETEGAMREDEVDGPDGAARANGAYPGRLFGGEASTLLEQ